MDKIVLVGAGGHCKSCIDVIEQEQKFHIIGITDKYLKPGKKILGYPVLGGDELLGEIRKEVKFALITVGQIETSQVRKVLYKQLVSLKFIMPICVSPRAYLASSAKIGQGTIIMHDALVNADVRIGNNVIVNSKALIEHDVFIEDNCHISTGALVNGGVKINSDCFIGSGAVVVQNTIISAGTFIKANALYKG